MKKIKKYIQNLKMVMDFQRLVKNAHIVENLLEMMENQIVFMKENPTIEYLRMNKI